MSCTSPLDAWPPAPGARDGRYVFTPQKSYSGAVPVRLPCGKCRSCRMERAGQMAVRAVHEAQMHAAKGRGSSFVTLTFDQANLPPDLSLSVKFIQRFHYRLRHVLGGAPRFLLAGEYGSLHKRPHYHAIYFGEDFAADRYPWKESSGGLLYRSPTLEKAWTYGHALIGDFSYGTGRYTAGYAVKDAAGFDDPAKYEREDASGRRWQVAREFMLSSRNPGLGADWFETYKADAFPSDHVIVEGKAVPVPRYYLNRLSAEDQQAVRDERRATGVQRRLRDASAFTPGALGREEREAVRDGLRRLARRGVAADDSDRRLLVKHELAELNSRRLKRDLDGES